MKTPWFFYIGAGIDIIGICIALYMMVGDMLKGYRGTNNPTMASITLGAAILVALAFWLKSSGHAKIGTALLWVPAAPLFLYGLFVLMFIILKPDMR